MRPLPEHLSKTAWAERKVREKPPLNHTPGPWKLEPTGDGDHGVYDAHGVGICVICDDWDDDPEPDYNARLIAAAPDLLEACEAVLAALDKVNGGGGFDLLDNDRCRRLLRSVIAKATDTS